MLGFLKPGILDIIDIIIVALFIYYLLRFLMGTRALHMLYALIAIFIISFFAQLINLRSVVLIVDSLKAIWVVAFFIIFQPEIRTVLARLGRYRTLGFFRLEERSYLIEELVKTSKLLSERKIGGLMVIKQEMGLKEYMETGTSLQAKVSAPLLASIFTPPSPLHDGACIIEGDEIVACSCILPVSSNPRLRFMGMRHRAGIGVTAVSDAVAIIVSEETGKISFANRGKLLSDLTPDALRVNLFQVLQKEPKQG